MIYANPWHSVSEILTLVFSWNHRHNETILRRRLSRNKKLILLSFTFITALSIYSGASGFITSEMLKSFSYFRWAHNAGEYKPEFLTSFMRDPRFRERFRGKPTATLRPYFPSLQNQTNYNTNSYRARNSPTNPGPQHVEHYWLDGSEQDFGVCVLVIDGKIAQFLWVKG
jgi:hypothetical protein